MAAPVMAMWAAITIMLVASSAGAVPYTGANTPALPSPAFNQYTGVPDVGNESDFFRGRQSGQGEFVNNVSSACNTGQEFSLRAYVHNGASQTKNNNGTGPSVAHNTKVRVALPADDTATSFPMTAYLSSSNAGSMSDGMSITCNGQEVKLSYVPGSAIQQNTISGVKPLSDSIVTTGAPIGTMSPNGDVWGCWDQRVIVYLKVKVTEVPKENPSNGVCKAASLEVIGDRKVRVSVTGTVENAEIVGYEINFGDGTKSSKQTDEHIYAKDGTYRIVTRVQVKLADGSTVWVTSEDCEKVVKFTADKPPVITTPPPVVTTSTLPNTGAGDIAGIFTAVSIAGAVVYRFVWLRRQYS